MKLTVLALLATGCVSISFDSDATEITVTAKGEHTLVEICAGTDGFLSCNEEDTFQVTLDGVTYGTRLSWFDRQVAEFDHDGSEALVTVTRDRDGAPAMVTIPPPFHATPLTLVSPSELVIEWSPPGAGKMRWDADVTCGTRRSVVGEGSTRDDGRFEIATAKIDLEPGEVCQFRLSLVREQRGEISSAFADDSYIAARQRRTQTIDLVRKP